MKIWIQTPGCCQHLHEGGKLFTATHQRCPGCGATLDLNQPLSECVDLASMVEAGTEVHDVIITEDLELSFWLLFASSPDLQDLDSLTRAVATGLDKPRLALAI